MRLVTLHADTPYRMYKEGLPFTSHSLHVSLRDLSVFDEVLSVFAFFSDEKLPDEVLFREFFNMKAHLDSALASCRLPEKNRFLYALEDARLLDGDETRLLALYEAGVRIITPLWRGHTCIGGAFDTDIGLSDFGKRALWRALSLGMIPDISHASERSAEDIFRLASDSHTPVLATHSNAYGVYGHKRNLRDHQLDSIIAGGGLVGISFAPQHLCPEGNASITHVLRHIHYYLEKGAEDALALGCDFDGIERTPTGISRMGELPRLYEQLEKRYSARLADKLFYENAASFFERVI